MRLVFLVLIILSAHSLRAQDFDSLYRRAEQLNTNFKLDSVQTLLDDTLFPLAKDDPSKLTQAYHLQGSIYLKRSQLDTALQFFFRALELAKEAKLSFEQHTALNGIGRTFYGLGKYDSSLFYHEESLRISKEINDKRAEGVTLSNIGILYDELGDYPKALDYYFRSLRIVEAIPNEQSAAYALMNIGAVYGQQKDMKRAITYQRKALKSFENVDDLYGLAIALGNLGEYYFQEKNYDSARYFAKKGLDLSQEIEDDIGIQIGFKTLGNIEISNKDYKSAAQSFLESEKVALAIGDISGLASIHGELSNVYLKLGQKQKALQYARSSLQYAKELASPNQIKTALEQLLGAEYKNGNLEEAFSLQSRLMELKDSIFNEEFSTQIANLRADYEIEKKQEEIDLLNEKSRLEKLARQRQVWVRNLFGVAALLFLGIVFVALRSRKRERDARIKATKQRDRLAEANKTITEQSTEIQQQHGELEAQNEYLEQVLNEVERKNTAITASINYAQRIQQAVLPEEKHFVETFADFFLLYRPRDIVSGDFYWLSEELENNERVIALADCTGHGVPGAFMAMAGDALLTQIVNQKNIYAPAQVLNELHESVRRHLHQDTNRNKDGMDASILHWQPQKKLLTFSGAKMPVLIEQNGEWIYQKGSRLSIGGERYKIQKEFETQEFTVEKGTTIYLFSDGIQDQFGGSKDRKISNKRFRKWLKETHHEEDLKKQKRLLEARLDEWMGKKLQIDDISVLAIRF